MYFHRMLLLPLGALLLDLTRAAPSKQTPSHLRHGASIADARSQRQLTGRFLHITGVPSRFFSFEKCSLRLLDFHLDPFYETHSSTERELACHRANGTAGFYGAETSTCDSPITLINETFRWIDENIKNDIDFVIWTGDSARHDNDEEIPRSPKQIEQLNEVLVAKFFEVFGKPENVNDTNPTNDFTIPIIPNFGNNDILPHNILAEGPNPWTRKYTHIWRQFIPEAQRHQFERGGWFYVEVVPKKLAVFSLNTLYFFDSNSAVDGCASRSEPGYEQFEWLHVQLEFLRQRGMKAILSGHVPPARTDDKMSWDETCWQKYTLWLRQYRDVIVGGLYGHMNIDHFMIQDFKAIDLDIVEGLGSKRIEKNGEYKKAAKGFKVAADYLTDLRNEWAKLPKMPSKDEEDSSSMDATSKKHKKGKRTKRQRYLKKIGGPWAERFSTALVGPSVIPNFFPTLRIFEYNITGLGSDSHPVEPSNSLEQHVASAGTLADMSVPVLDRVKTLLGIWSRTSSQSDLANDGESVDVRQNLIPGSPPPHDENKKKRKKGRKKHKRPRFTIPNPPSKTAPPGPAYSPQVLSLLGYTQYYANLTRINGDVGDDRDVDAPEPEVAVSANSRANPRRFKYAVEYDTRQDKDGFGLADLTVRSYVRLAQRIGHSKGRDPPDSVEDKESFYDDGRGEEAQEEQGGEDFCDDFEGGDDQAALHRGKGKDGKSINKDYDDGWDEEEQEEQDGEDFSDEFEGGDDQVALHRRKGKKGKSINKVWFTFVQRAFVGTVDSESIREQFGSRNISVDDGEW